MPRHVRVAEGRVHSLWCDGRTALDTVGDRRLDLNVVTSARPGEPINNDQLWRTRTLKLQLTALRKVPISHYSAVMDGHVDSRLEPEGEALLPREQRRGQYAK